MLLQTIARNIRQRRQAQSIPLKQLCLGSCLSEHEWAQAEQGSNLTLAQLCGIAEVLQCAPHQLFNEGHVEPDYTVIEHCIPHFMPDCTNSRACHVFDAGCRDTLRTYTLRDVDCAGYGSVGTFRICETPCPDGMTYGIQAIYRSRHGIASYVVRDVCPNRAEIENFVQFLSRKQPSRIHFYDLITDFVEGYQML